MKPWAAVCLFLGILPSLWLVVRLDTAVVPTAPFLRVLWGVLAIGVASFAGSYLLQGHVAGSISVVKGLRCVLAGSVAGACVGFLALVLKETRQFLFGLLTCSVMSSATGNVWDPVGSVFPLACARTVAACISAALAALAVNLNACLLKGDSNKGGNDCDSDDDSSSGGALDDCINICNGAQRSGVEHYLCMKRCREETSLRANQRRCMECSDFLGCLFAQIKKEVYEESQQAVASLKSGRKGTKIRALKLLLLVWAPFFLNAAYLLTRVEPIGEWFIWTLRFLLTLVTAKLTYPAIPVIFALVASYLKRST